MRTKIIATGLSGMVGSRIVELLGETVEFEDVSEPVRTNIVDPSAVYTRIASSDAPYVLHLAAKANPDECEKDKLEDGKKLQNYIVQDILDTTKIDTREWMGSTSAFAVNVAGTKNIAEAAQKTGKKLIHISTDYVFYGDTKDAYTEESMPNAINYYGRTKQWAEDVVTAIDPTFLILRIAIPFGSRSQYKPDIVARFRSLFEQNREINATEDQLITPTLIADIANALNVLTAKNAQGIYHVVGSTTLSPFDFALAIAETFGYDKRLVKKARSIDFYKGRAPRPQYLTMNNAKIRALGVMPRTISAALHELQTTQ